MITIKQLDDLFDIVTKDREKYPELRLGQSFWNNLIKHYPEYECTRGTELDCFHRTSRMLPLIQHICGDQVFREWLDNEPLKI